MARVSATDIAKLHKKALSLQMATRKAREKAGEVTERVVTAGETVGAALAMGYARARFGDKPFEIAGVPIDMGAGIIGTILSIMGVGRGMEGHVAAFSNGSMAAYAAGIGYKAGLKKTAESGPLVKGEALSDLQLSDLAVQLKKFAEGGE